MDYRKNKHLYDASDFGIETTVFTYLVGSVFLSIVLTFLDDLSNPTILGYVGLLFSYIFVTITVGVFVHIIPAGLFKFGVDLIDYMKIPKQLKFGLTILLGFLLMLGVFLLLLKVINFVDYYANFPAVLMCFMAYFVPFVFWVSYRDYWGVLAMRSTEEEHPEILDQMDS